jgi:N-acetylneuraminic acid mutarotase
MKMLIRSTLLVVLAVLSAGLLRAKDAGKFAPLPQKISSLGACVSDGYVYVYGGHTGQTHTYSTDTTTGKFLRVKATGGKWEELPSGPSLQGLALVAHKGKIYRIGGMQPRNKPGEKSNNHSLTDFAVFDPAAKKWQNLTALPEGRSSHDAVVVGDQVYVFGGWKMNGEGKEPTWHTTGLVLDLAKSPSKWQTVEQPFARRALAVEALGGKVYVLGGLRAKKKGAQSGVDIYDPMTSKWSEGPAIPSRATTMGTGFSPAACVQEGRLYLSTNDGKINRLSKDGKSWESVGEQAVKRFVPRLLAGPKGALIVVGGSMGHGDDGDPKQVEVITPK